MQPVCIMLPFTRLHTISDVNYCNNLAFVYYSTVLMKTSLTATNKTKTKNNKIRGNFEKSEMRPVSSLFHEIWTQI